MLYNDNSKIINTELVDEMENSMLNYAMSVIVSRALPDAKDGLKPVHRRILYSMFEDGLTVDKRKIVLAENIRTYGSFDLDVKLYPEINGKIHVLVCSK